MSDSFDPSLALDYSIYLERVASLLQPHPNGWLSFFDKSKKSYYLLDIAQKSLKQKIALDMAKGENPEFGRVSIAQEIPRFAFIEPDEEHVRVMDGASLQNIATIHCAKSKVESIHLTSDGKGLYTGGKDGLITLWDVEEKRVIAQISKHQDFVYLIKESPCGEFILSVGYDRSLFLYHKGKGMRGECIHVASHLPRSILFLSGGYVAIGESRGEVVILDCLLRRVATRFRVTHEEIIAMEALGEGVILFLSKFGKLGSVDYLKGEVRSDDYLPAKKRYASMALEAQGERLVLSTQDGYIRSYKLGELLPWLERLVEKEETNHAYELMAAHPHLRGSKSAMVLEARFEIALLEAWGLMEEERISEAQQRLALYLTIPEKRMIVQKHIEQLRQIPDLRSYLKDSYLLRAHSLVQTRPLLAQTSTAKSMDESFLKALWSAKELLKRGQKEEADKAIFIHKAVNARSKMIKEVFSNPFLIDTVLETIQKGDYRRYFELKRQFSVVSFLPQAKAFEEREEELYFELEEAFCLGNLERAKECMETLLLFPKGEERVKPWAQKIKEFKGKIPLGAE